MREADGPGSSRAPSSAACGGSVSGRSASSPRARGGTRGANFTGRLGQSHVAPADRARGGARAEGGAREQRCRESGEPVRGRDDPAPPGTARRSAADTTRASTYHSSHSRCTRGIAGWRSGGPHEHTGQAPRGPRRASGDRSVNSRDAAADPPRRQRDPIPRSDTVCRIRDPLRAVEHTRWERLRRANPGIERAVEVSTFEPMGRAGKSPVQRRYTGAGQPAGPVTTPRIAEHRVSPDLAADTPTAIPPPGIATTDVPCAAAREVVSLSYDPFMDAV